MDQSGVIPELPRTDISGPAPSGLTQSSEHYAKFLSLIEMHIEQAEATCGVDATVNPMDVPKETIDLFMAKIGGHAKSLAKFLRAATDAAAGIVERTVEEMAKERIKPMLTMAVTAMASEKRLKEGLVEGLEALRAITEEQDDHLPQLENLHNAAVRSINAQANSTTGDFQRLKFTPPLQLHLRNGTPLEPIHGLRLDISSETGAAVLKAVRAYQNDLANVKKSEEKNTENDAAFYPWYANALVEDGAFLADRFTNIQESLGVPWQTRLRDKVLFTSALNVLRGHYGAHHSNTEGPETIGTPQEVRNQESFVAGMENDPIERLLELARKLEATAEGEDGRNPEVHPSVKSFVDDLPIVVGWCLSHKNFVKRIKNVIADVAEYLSDYPSKPELEQVRAGGS
eukprot:CAMPEP_0117462160 /NCGR_PEP_ID=MMETSP0784-20121206/2909_1 /TAXON_ID=39447 /ORGANISM="" /LENGTH=399 /DNA_ID=CAMNT_0005255913 /DNA_START=126 /DNA_END=1321 /DNA_ORIENTATION=+